jgi:hypothetical protein
MMKLQGKQLRPKTMVMKKKKKEKDKGKKSEELKSTNFKETLVLWKNGFRRGSRIGSRTWLTKRKESKANWSLSTSRPKNSILSQWARLNKPHLR